MAANHFNDLRALAGKFTEGSWPDMLCPSCAKGTLTPVGKGAIQQFETAESIEARDHSDWEPEWISGHFQGRLRCSKNGCRDSVLVMGKYSYVQSGASMEFEASYQPMYFLPALLLINSDGRFPDSVVQLANDASAVLWSDPSSAANRVRAAVEKLLTLNKVKRYTIAKNQRRVRVTLDARIKLFSTMRVKHAPAADLLMAIKWIGNDGSHERGLTALQVIDAAELLEHALSLIYDKPGRELARKAAKINKRKGVV